jgi:Photosynthesis system II assembly factor YCF48
MATDDRDRQFERALSRHLSNASPDSACPDAEILAAYHERSLSIEEMSRWKEHIAACAHCQEALALVEQSENVLTTEQQGLRELEPIARMAAGAVTSAGVARMPQAVTSSPGSAPAAQTVGVHKLGSRAAWSWIVPLGAVAASVIVWVSVREIRTQHAKQTQVALNRLPAPLPPAPQFNVKEQPQKEEAPAKKMQNEAALRKLPPSAAANSSPTQTLATPRPSASNELTRSARKDSLSAIGGAGVTPEPSPSVSSYAAESGTVESNAPPPSNTAPSAAAAPSIPVQQNEENKTAQVSKEKSTAQPQVAAPRMTSAQMVAGPLNGADLVQTALADRHYIVAPGEKHAWRLGDGGLIELSTDRGKTWKPQSSGVTADLTAGSATSDKVCWVVGKSGTLLLTTDGGKNWKVLSSPIPSDLGGVHATNAQHASIWDVSNRNSFETNDGGTTWQRTANE